MPYATNSELPQSVRNAIPSANGKAIFRNVVNSQLKAGKSEEVAFASAWAAIQRAGYEKTERGWIKKASGAVPVYAFRPVLNAEEIVAWAQSVGLEKTLTPDDMHVTVVYSKTPFMGIDQVQSDVLCLWSDRRIIRGGKRSVDRFGKMGEVLVLKLDSVDLTQEWLDHRRAGASWDWDGYQPHISLTYSAPEGIDASSIEPYDGDIVLGPLSYRPIDPNWSDKVVEKNDPTTDSVHVPSADWRIRRRIKKAESYLPPESARNNAKKALKWRDEHGDAVKGGTQVGWTRANQLASGEKLSLSTVKRMAQFNRHRKNSEVAPEYKSEPWKDAGHVAWLLWGGSAGVDWAKSISERVVKSTESMDALTVEKNVAVRDLLIRDWNLGPAVTSGTNDAYWSKMAEVWMIPEQEARRQLCANCEYFDNTPEALASMESIPNDKFDADGGGRGYCHKFDFICHNLRTCQAWEKKEYEMEDSAESVEKRQVNDDLFTDMLGAMVRSVDLGLQGDVHYVVVDGQLYYRPGEDEEDYVEALWPDAESDDEESNGDLLDAAIRAILGAVMEKSNNINSSVSIIKADDEQRIVWGWVSVATENGEPVYDVHGDYIPMEELTKASVDFMRNYRVGKTEHFGKQTSEVIAMLPLSKSLADALGIKTDREGLIAGFKVHDDATWKGVKSGNLPAFSIGGRGERHAAE